MERILLVEESASPRSSLAPRLSAAGLHVERVDPRTDLERCRKRDPCDVVVVHAPASSGVPAAVRAALSSESAGALIPILEVVADNGEVPDAADRSEVVDEQFTLPRDWDHLLRAVRSRAKSRRRLCRWYEAEMQKKRVKLASALSHEMFLPLMEIEATSDYLTTSCSDRLQDDVTALLEDIGRASHTAYRTLKKLALHETLGKAESQLAGTGPAASLALEVTATVIEVASHTARYHGRDDDLAFRVEPVSVSIPAVDVAEIVETLVERALAATKPGTAVTVTCETRTQCELAVSFRPCADALQAHMDGWAPAPGSETGDAGLTVSGLHIGEEIVRRIVRIHGGEFQWVQRAGGRVDALVRLPVAAHAMQPNGPETEQAFVA